MDGQVNLSNGYYSVVKEEGTISSFFFTTPELVLQLLLDSPLIEIEAPPAIRKKGQKHQKQSTWYPETRIRSPYTQQPHSPARN